MNFWIFHTATLSNYLAHTYTQLKQLVTKCCLGETHATKLNLFWTSFPFSFKQNVKMQHNSSHQ